MPALRLRHERFCQAYIECANATAAARSAGYAATSARNAGYRLLRKPEILARIRELQHDIASRECTDPDVMLSKLEIVYRRAIHDRHFSAAARAVELQAKLAGSIQTRPVARAKPETDKREGRAAIADNAED